MTEILDERIKTIMDLVDAHATHARIGGASDKYRERITDALKLWMLGGENVDDAFLTEYRRKMDHRMQEVLLTQMEELLTDPDESLTFRRREEGGLQIVWRRQPDSGMRDSVGHDGLRMSGNYPSKERHILRHHALTYARFNGGPAAGLALDLGGMRKQLVDADLMGDDS